MSINRATDYRKIVSRFLLLTILVLQSFASFADVPAAIEKRLSRIERLLNNQNLLQMYSTQQTLKQELSGLRGDVELINHELEQVKQQQKDIYIDLDQRIQDLEKSVSSLRSMPPVTGMPALPAVDAASEVAPDTSLEPSATLEPEAVVQDSLGEQESYQEALAVLKNGEYEQAIETFQVFLISYPASDYAVNAQYWMAEAYYVLKDYQSAVSHFKKVITAYPGSRKAADAHLKVGFSYYELKDWVNAQAALEKVVSDFSTSTAARLAQRRLEKMKLEGHR